MSEKLPSRELKRSLTTASDFDFSDFKTPRTLGESDRFSENDVDSDIEDAIYARVYFDARDESHQSQIQGTFLESRGPHLGEGGGASPAGWSVSLAFSSSAAPGDKTQDNSSTKRKKTSKGKRKSGLSTSSVKRKRKKGSARPSAEETPPSERSSPSDVADGGDLVVMDTYNAPESSQLLIDLTGDSTSEVIADEVTSTSTKSQRRRQRQKERKKNRIEQDAGKANASGGNANPLRSRRELNSSAAEADIKRLFSGPEESGVIVLSSDEESGGDRGGVVSTGSGNSSSVESGELVGSSERSRVSSDMDVCSEGSVEVTKIEDSWMINEKDRLGADAYERLHGLGDSVNRYYGQRSTKCTNCKQRGHATKNCPWPKRHTVCYVCAEHGHISSNCPRNLCTYCYREKHRGRPCRAAWASLTTVCTRCFMKGHHASICPDNWRQFHHTTYDRYSLVTFDLRHQRRMDRVYCSNCASQGHFGFECTRTLPRGNPSYHTPLIAHYDQTAWPPRDHYSLAIIQKALNSRPEPGIPDPQPGTPDPTPSSSTHGRKRARGDHRPQEDTVRRNKISPPRKRTREASPHSSGKRQKSKKFGKNVDARDSMMDERGDSLLITVDGRGSKTVVGRRHSLQDTTPPMNHALPRARPSLLGAPPGRDFPRVPHPSPYHSPPDFSPHFPMDQGVSGRYNRASPGGGQGVWHYDSPDHSFTPLPPSGLVSRSLSTGDHHLPTQHYRRHSEHLERYDHRSPHQHHDDRRPVPPLIATPTYPGPRSSNRSSLMSHRGFQMSLEAAHRTGAYDRSPAASGSGRYGGDERTPERRYSHEYTR